MSSPTVALAGFSDASISSEPPIGHRVEQGRLHEDAAAYLRQWIRSEPVRPVPFSTEPLPTEHQLELGL